MICLEVKLYKIIIYYFDVCCLFIWYMNLFTTPASVVSLSLSLSIFDLSFKHPRAFVDA